MVLFPIHIFSYTYIFIKRMKSADSDQLTPSSDNIDANAYALDALVTAFALLAARTSELTIGYCKSS